MRKSILLAALLAGCAVGPEYREPPDPSAAFVGADPARYAAGSPEARWWSQFQDPLLDRLVAQGLAANLDLSIAAARVAGARALFDDRRLDQLPAVSAGASYVRGEGPARSDTKSASLGFDAAWEIDLFGRVRHEVAAARADAEGAEFQRRGVAVTVAAEIAREYFELRGAQQQAVAARANLGNQRESLELTRVRLDAGSGTELDVASAQARLSATAAAIPPLDARARRAQNRLAVLLGRAPGELAENLAPRPVTPLVKELAIGTPSELLRRRPDVRAAERELAAATARVGVATADLFPRLSLTGFVGLVAGNPAALGGSLAKAWTVAPALSWPAFDLGSARARLRGADARTEAALAAYQKAVLQALEETSNALDGYTQQQSRLAHLADQAAASRRAAELAAIQYREGAIDYLRLLDAQSGLLQAEDAVAAGEAALQVSVVALYKALGGGWEAAGSL